MGSAEIVTLIIFLGVFLLLILVGREVVCWYLKINERLKQTIDLSLQLDKVEEELKKININLDILNKNKDSNHSKSDWVIITLTEKHLKYFVIIVISAFIISMIIDKEWAESFWGPSKAENQQTSNETVTLNQKQISLIEGMIAEGQLDIKLNENKAYILKELWEAMKYDSKEDFTAGLSIYIQNKKNNNRFYCTVFDIYSGKRLAKYEGRRFEVFN